MIFLDRLNCIDGTIQSQLHVKLLPREKIGETCLFVFDESTRMLAIYTSAKVCPCANFLRQRDRRFTDATPYVRI
jgi:hypothetical protein